MIPSIFLKNIFFLEVMYVCEERKHFFRVLFAEMGENKRYFGLKKKSFPIDVQCFIFFFSALTLIKFV